MLAPFPILVALFACFAAVFAAIRVVVRVVSGQVRGAIPRPCSRHCGNPQCIQFNPIAATYCRRCGRPVVRAGGNPFRYAFGRPWQGYVNPIWGQPLRGGLHLRWQMRWQARETRRRVRAAARQVRRECRAAARGWRPNPPAPRPVNSDFTNSA